MLDKPKVEIFGVAPVLLDDLLVKMETNSTLHSLWSFVLVAVCVLVFSIVNLHNILRYHPRRPGKPTEPDAPWPSGLIVDLAAFGTFAFFLESLLYLILNILDGWFFSFFDVNLMDIAELEIVGALTMTAGYAVFVWSVLARGKYATSWTMSANHRLVSWGPYRYVRHPSYLGYFLMFTGLLLLWHNFLVLIPLIGIPGYVLVANQEEKMLIKRFGEKYVKYMQNTGRFLPSLRFRRLTSNQDL